MLSKRSVAISSFVFLCIGSQFLLTGCDLHKSTTTKQKAAIPVNVQDVKMSEVQNELTFDGTITPYVETTLSAATNGILKTVNVRPGDTVQAGQVIASLDQSQNVAQQNAVQQAQSSVQSARQSLTNAQAVAKDKTTAKQQLVSAQNAVQEAEASVQSARQAVNNAEAVAKDKTSAEQQLVSAQNTVSTAQAAVQEAEANLKEAQLKAQASLSGGSTPQDAQALQAVVTEDQQSLEAAQKQLSTAQDNESLANKTLTDDQKQFGQITEQQVQAAYEAYQSSLGLYGLWQSNGGGLGQNPYSAPLQANQTTYDADSTAYNTLQQAQQQYNQSVQSVSQAQAQVASAQSALTEAQKNLADAEPDSSSNAAQQDQASVQSAQASYDSASAQYKAAQNALSVAQQVYNDNTQSQTNVASAKASLNSANAQYKAAQNALKVAQEAYDDNTQSQANIKSDQSSVDQAQVQLATAQATMALQVKNDEIISPISGKVVSVAAQAGQGVSSQTSILTIEATSPQVATLNVPESDISNIQVGENIQVTLPALSKTTTGKVLDIRPQLDTSTNEYQVDVTLTTPDSKIQTGMQVEASLKLPSTARSIEVPATSVLALEGGGQEVFIVKNGVAHSQIVELGNITSNSDQITSGLTPGETLVISGQNYLSDGDKVKIVHSSNG